MATDSRRADQCLPTVSMVSLQRSMLLSEGTNSASGCGYRFPHHGAVRIVPAV